MTDKQIIIKDYFNIMRDENGRIFCIQEIGDPKSLIKAIREQNEYIQAKEQECEELKQYKSLFEKTRNLWNESRMNNYKLLDEIKDLKDSLKRTICQSECYKHKEADKLKQILIEIKEFIQSDYCTEIASCEFCAEAGNCLNRKILQKISEVQDV